MSESDSDRCATASERVSEWRNERGIDEERNAARSGHHRLARP